MQDTYLIYGEDYSLIKREIDNIIGNNVDVIKYDLSVNKIDELLDDVKSKVKTLDRVFELVDTVNDKVALLGDTVVGFVSGAVKRFFKERKNKNKGDEDDE